MQQYKICIEHITYIFRPGYFSKIWTDAETNSYKITNFIEGDTLTAITSNGGTTQQLTISIKEKNAVKIIKDDPSNSTANPKNVQTETLE